LSQRQEVYISFINFFIQKYIFISVKLHFAEETWLKSKYPLTKQAGSDCVLVLKKRYYTKDSTLDKNDQIQLHLAYVQAHEEILSGCHPLTHDEAAMFGGLQCQMEHGAFKQDAYKSGNTPVKLQTMLPTIWAKASGMEKDVVQQWKNFSSLDITDARMRFMQLCQTLRTYGFNLFTVEIGLNFLKNKNKKTIISH
jgi:FERM central domain.